MLKACGVNGKLLNGLKSVYKDAKSSVKVKQEMGEGFRIHEGCKALALHPHVF